MTRFEYSTDVAVGDWIAPLLAGGFGAVGLVCPTGFEAYARVFHPVGEERLRWADVCAATGGVAHPLMQWGRISGVSYGVRLFGDWDGGEPQTGSLDRRALATLSEAIGRDSPITVGVWHGYGDWPAHGPTLDLPGRSYYLYTGTLAALDDPLWPESSGWPWPDSITLNLAWPDDRSWFVASEIDFDSTVVGGSRELVDRVLSSGLESAEVTAASDLSWEGDVVNRAV